LKTLSSPPVTAALTATPRSRRFFTNWTDFWFSPVNPVALCRLRFFSGLLFFFWLLPFAGNVEALYGLNGWFDRTAYLQASAPPNPQEFGWSLLYVVGGNAATLKAVYWGALGIFLLFALGICVRVTALLSWLMVVSFLATPAASFDADSLVAVIAFYMLIGHLFIGQWSRASSPLERIFGPRDVGLPSLFMDRQADREPVGSYAANLAVRLLQVHFAIVVVASGLHKLQSGDWWSGWAFWYPMHPPYETTQAIIEAEAKASVDAATGTISGKFFWISLCEYLVLAWQIGFPLFAWKKNWRVLLLGGAVIGWLGCVFLYKLPVFGPAYMIGCLSFLTPEEWLGLKRFLSRFAPRASAAAERTTRFQPRVSQR
jgi:hypothetical protein